MIYSSIFKMGLWLFVLAMAWSAGCGWTPPIDHEQEQPPPIVFPAMDVDPIDLIGQEVTGEPPVDEPVANPLVHIVKWNRETLFVISQWYTGSGNNWKRLAAANPDINAHKIHIGDKILIPEELLKKRKPLPFDIIKPIPVRKNASPPQPPKPPLPTQEIPLFGPIESDTSSKTNEGNDLPVPLETID